jgi:hypothetical protein
MRCPLNLDREAVKFGVQAGPVAFFTGIKSFYGKQVTFPAGSK